MSLALFRDSAQTVWRFLRKPTSLPAIIALAVVMIAGLWADNQNTVLYDHSERASVQTQLGVIRAKLEGKINGNIQLVQGLVATLSTEPGMQQDRFSQLADNLFDKGSQLRNIAGAPGFVVSLMYPMEGNEKAIGLDYRTNEAQRGAVFKARDTKQMVLAGPVNLVQGGQGFIGRFPVFIGESYAKQFWGVISAVIDVDRLYTESGLLDPALPISVAITGVDGMGGAGKQFFGPETVLLSNPVRSDVTLPSGSWEISAIPKGGWVETPPSALGLRIVIALLGGLALLPILIGGRLVEERQKHIKALGLREAELQRLSRRLGMALETSRVGVWELNLDTGELLWDDRVNAIFGLPQDGGKRGYSDWRDALHPEDLSRAEAEFKRAVEVTGQYHSDYRMFGKDGETKNIRAIGTVYKDPGAGTKVVGVNWDVTADVALNESLKRANRLSEARNAELVETKARIEHNSLHDSLTGLPNRRYLDDILKRHAARCALNGRTLALLHIDLDRFKQINDTLGHAAGDAMLVHASEVLKSKIRPEDFVARIGGDEFVVVSTSDNETPLADLANRIIVHMRQPVIYEGHECRFGVSVGIAVATGSEVDPRKLLINADIALYKAKSRGRNRFEFFSQELQAEVVKTKRVADQILQGLDRGEFEPYYQPQFDARTLDVVGCEALARWRHPVEGILAPAAFMDVAEELNVVSTIDRIVLEQTLKQFELWEADGLGVPRVSVNVSSRRLQDEQLIGGLRDLNIRPGTVSFELVESIFLDESDGVVLWHIDQIKDLGIDIEIDDFGTGYASIVSLMKLKPKRLKIDRQLVMPIVESAAQRHLVESVIEIGKALDIEVVGEGVETMEHARILRDLGCDILQGFAFAHPMNAENLVTFLKAGAWREQAAPLRRTRSPANKRSA